MRPSKSFSTLTLEDLAENPVWRHKPPELLQVGEDESWVEAVHSWPVTDAVDHYFATMARLADGSQELTLIGKTELRTLEATERSQTFTFFRGVKQHHWTNSPPWFNPECGDIQLLASFLGKTVEQVFPFHYDLSNYLAGDERIVQRAVQPRSYPKNGSALEAAMAAALRSIQSAS